MKFNRFDFEQQILECWNVTKDIRNVQEALDDRIPNFTEDELANLLLGIHSLYELKFEKLWNMFEAGVHSAKFQEKDSFGLDN